MTGIADKIAALRSGSPPAVTSGRTALRTGMKRIKLKAHKNAAEIGRKTCGKRPQREKAERKEGTF